jgi:uncharacterized protein (DUF58 family)
MSAGTIIFLLLFLSITLAGFNSGNNLLYLMAGVMLAAMVVAGVAGRINISRITVSRRLPPHAFVGQPFKIILEITNRKKRLHSYGIGVADSAHGVGNLFIPFIKKKGKVSRTAELSFTKRGLYGFGVVVVSSRFPWALFDLKKKSMVAQDLIVYPAIFEMEKVIIGSSRIRDEFPLASKGPGGGLYGIREYRHGEDISTVSWKLSAKMDKLIVRETEAEGKKKVCIVFDNILEGRSESDLERFEHSISSAASLIWYLCRNGYLVKLVTRDKIIGYGNGSEQMHRMLIVLALIQPIDPHQDGLILDKRLFEGGAGVLVHCADGAAANHAAAKDFAVVISGIKASQS